MPPTPGLGSALGRFPDFTSRAAVYAIRTYGGKGGAPREGRPYPNRLLVAFCLSHGGSMLLVSGLAPFSSNSRSASSCLYRRASQSGVIPNFTGAFTSAP